LSILTASIDVNVPRAVPRIGDGAGSIGRMPPLLLDADQSGNGTGEKETNVTGTLVETTAALEGGQLVVFTLGGEAYGLPIAEVQEIIRYQEPRRVAAEKDWVVGVISLRGKIVPVCDLGLRLGRTAHERCDAKIVIVDAGTGTAGIIVDDVSEVLTVEAGRLDPLPAGRTDFMTAIAKLDERLVVVLDPQRLFEDLDL
jgi:purine-binding chemotaxis protein CheW